MWVNSVPWSRLMQPDTCLRRVSDNEGFMNTLYSLFPDADAVLEMTPEDLGGVLLRLALPRVQGAGFIPHTVAQRGYIPPYNVAQTLAHEAAEDGDYPVNKRQAVLELVNRTWEMLEREGFIEPSLSMNGRYGWRQFSEKGLKIAQGEDLCASSSEVSDAIPVHR